MKSANQQTIGFFFTSVVGVLLHFLYDWTGKNKLAALFSGVNESTWEHIKLLFVPMLVFALLQSIFLESKSDYFWCIKLKSILLGMLLIPALFYTLNGIFGRTPDWINISIFFVSVAAAYIYEYKLYGKERKCTLSSRASLYILFIIALLFVIFTFTPPQLPLFFSPV